MRPRSPAAGFSGAGSRPPRPSKSRRSSTFSMVLSPFEARNHLGSSRFSWSPRLELHRVARHVVSRHGSHLKALQQVGRRQRPAPQVTFLHPHGTGAAPPSLRRAAHEVAALQHVLRPLVLHVDPRHHGVAPRRQREIAPRRCPGVDVFEANPVRRMASRRSKSLWMASSRLRAWASSHSWP